MFKVASKTPDRGYGGVERHRAIVPAAVAARGGVAALTLAGEMLKHLKPLFPDDLQMAEVLTSPPPGEQH